MNVWYEKIFLIKLNNFIYHLLIILLGFNFSLVAQTTSKDINIINNADSYISIPNDSILLDSGLVMPHRFNPFLAGGLSLIIPGSGQLYCKKKGRSLAFFLADGISFSIMLNRSSNFRNQESDFYELKKESDIYKENLILSNIFDPTSFAVACSLFEASRLETNLSEFYTVKAKYTRNQSIGWFAGIHLWNIMNSLSSSNFFYDDDYRSPLKAGLLSAIPVLALGQIYNGSLTKAGMMWVIQAMLGYQAFNYNRLMSDAKDSRTSFLDSTSWKNKFSDKYIPIWEREYVSAFKERNTFLWYSVFFYFYGVFDAVVDAHLHDYRKRIRFETSFNPKDDKMLFSAVFNF